jgi:murein DD-endopeptidase MepM/ murein hydrolase activator NlpD
MRRATLISLGVASVAALVLVVRKRTGSIGLGSPIEPAGTPSVTPHGHFSADRTGPPAHLHQGIDLAAPAGTRVLAVGDGMIVATDPGLGKVVRKLLLDRPDAWLPGSRRVKAVVYADLGTPLKHPGDRVRKGDPIALVDKAGFVHFAVKAQERSGEVFFNPSEAGFVYRLSKPEVV